jgi:hypothetical protein
MTSLYLNPDVNDWASVARMELHRLASTRTRLTSDDLWDVLRRSHPDLLPPSDPRAIAGVFRSAARERWLTKTAFYQPSRDRTCHGRPKRIWQSLLCG